MITTTLGQSSLLDRSQSTAQTALQRLASGKRINSAADDAAGLAIATTMLSQAGGSQQAIGNAMNGISVTQTADDALGQISDNLTRMRELTVQAGDGTLNASDRQSIQDEINQLNDANDQISAQTNFNDQKLLDGSFSGQIQVGANAGDTLELNIGNASSSALGTSGVDVANIDAVSSALNSIDQAQSTISGYRSAVAGTEAGLNAQIADQQNTYENLVASASQIQDTDYAQETANLQQGLVQQQVSLYAQNQLQSSQKQQIQALIGAA